MIRAALHAVILLAVVGAATPVFAHASLLSSYPVDSQLLQTAPPTVRLTFNEQVSIVELQVTDAIGARHVLANVHLEGDSVVAAMPALLPDGTDALSWRVVSADGHPVGGTIVFSVGSVTDNIAGAAQPEPTPALYPAIWVLGLVLYASLFVGIGGAFFAAWIAPPRALPRFAVRAMVWAIGTGMVAAVLSVGVEGLDVLGADFSRLGEIATWAAGFSASIGTTMIVILVALLSGLGALLISARQWSRPLAAVGVIGIGVALSLSGHAADAPPRSLTWAAVFLHAVGATVWLGALFPLAVLIGSNRAGAKPALMQFSRLVPLAIVPLVVAGLILALVEMVHVSDFWTTDYGRLLAVKLTAVTALFAVAADNRRRLTPRAAAGDRRSAKALTRSIAIELALMAVVLAVVAGWRLTPPPRALFATAAARPLYAMAASPDGTTMADVNVLPGRVGQNQVVVRVADRQMMPLAAQEVTVSLSNPDAGIEPITKTARKASDGTWHVDGLTLPVAGVWHITVNALITDFVEANPEALFVIPD
jgi:copper transport protein